jgi:hypothetical protein
MAYNLPPAWDPGFVMPKNVADEGLERRAFITKWMPRGTYDDSTDGTAGYMVPQYVKDEGIGQGTFTTKWQPSGTYNGPKVPHWLNQRPTVTNVTRLSGGARQVTVQPLGDDAPLPARFESYGQQAAQALISRVQNLPLAKRQAALRAIMDTVDKSLWTRTQDIFHRYVREQKIPPANAFPLALARAMSAGIAAEIIQTGLRGTAPQAKSLLGLGCYGCAAVLGALGDAAPVACTTTPGFSWVYETTLGGQVVPGHWVRTAKGATDVPFCPGAAPPSGATTVTVAPPTVRSHQDDYYIGPFGFSIDTLDRAWALARATDIANRATSPDILYPSPDTSKVIGAQPVGSPVRPIIPEVLAWLRARLTEATDANGKSDTPVHYTDSGAYGYPESDAPAWFNAIGISPTTPVRMHVIWPLRTAITPLAKTKHPVTGKDMVLHVQLARLDITKSWNATSNPLVLKVWASTVPDPTLWASIWNTLIDIPATVVMPISEAVKAGLNDLADLACQAFSGAAGQAAGAAAAAAAGAPPQAGAAGAAIAQQACSKPPPPPVIARPSMLPVVLIAGGALVAIVLLTTPRKSS